MDWLDVAAQGILLGGVYGLFALGLSLVFGIMRLVNLAHGDLIVLAAYLVLFTSGMAGCRSAPQHCLPSPQCSFSVICCNVSFSIASSATT